MKCQEISMGPSISTIQCSYFYNKLSCEEPTDVEGEWDSVELTAKHLGSSLSITNTIL
jgi:hypothetical protein